MIVQGECCRSPASDVLKWLNNSYTTGHVTIAVVSSTAQGRAASLGADGTRSCRSENCDIFQNCAVSRSTADAYSTGKTEPGFQTRLFRTILWNALSIGVV